MRDFLNAPNGLSKQSFPVNERLDFDPSKSPLSGRTVWKIVLNDATLEFLDGSIAILRSYLSLCFPGCF